MRTVTRCFLALAAFVLVLPVFSYAQTASDMEILRQKIKADKKLVVAEAMQLTEAEAKGFWPVYDAFQADLDKINGQIGQVIKAYAAAYRADTLTNEKAQELLGEAIRVQPFLRLYESGGRFDFVYGAGVPGDSATVGVPTAAATCSRLSRAGS